MSFQTRLAIYVAVGVAAFSAGQMLAQRTSSMQKPPVQGTPLQQSAIVSHD